MLNVTRISTALEKWNLGPADIHPHNPLLIFTRVSGYGQNGPWSSRPGYASVCEAQSGFRYINGHPDPETGGLSGPPIRPNISLGDSVAGLHAAFGTVSHVYYHDILMPRVQHYCRSWRCSQERTNKLPVRQAVRRLMSASSRGTSHRMVK